MVHNFESIQKLNLVLNLKQGEFLTRQMVPLGRSCESAQYLLLKLGFNLPKGRQSAAKRSTLRRCSLGKCPGFRWFLRWSMERLPLWWYKSWLESDSITAFLCVLNPLWSKSQERIPEPLQLPRGMDTPKRKLLFVHRAESRLGWCSSVSIYL